MLSISFSSINNKYCYWNFLMAFSKPDLSARLFRWLAWSNFISGSPPEATENDYPFVGLVGAIFNIFWHVCSVGCNTNWNCCAIWKVKLFVSLAHIWLQLFIICVHASGAYYPLNCLVSLYCTSARCSLVLIEAYSRTLLNTLW